MYSSAVALSQQQQEKDRSHLNVIDFFDPDLLAATTYRPKHNYTLKYGVSGYPKAGKMVDYAQDDGIYTSVQVGDDAYFLRSDGLGVSDGVGGKMMMLIMVFIGWCAHLIVIIFIFM
jgi:hypothetical protein